MPLQENGNYTIYNVEYRGYGKGDNRVWNGVFHGQAPNFFDPGDCKEHKEIDVLDNGKPSEMGPCGHCWQQTGEYGTFDEDLAIKILRILHNKHQNTDFRIRKYEVSQKSEIIHMAKRKVKRQKARCQMLAEVVP